MTFSHNKKSSSQRYHGTEPGTIWSYQHWYTAPVFSIRQYSIFFAYLINKPIYLARTDKFIDFDYNLYHLSHLPFILYVDLPVDIIFFCLFLWFFFLFAIVSNVSNIYFDSCCFFSLFFHLLFSLFIFFFYCYSRILLIVSSFMIVTLDTMLFKGVLVNVYVHRGLVKVFERERWQE